MNSNGDVVLGDHVLLGHIEGLHLNGDNAEGLGAGVVIVGARTNNSLQLAELDGIRLP